MSVASQRLEVVSPLVDGALVDYWYLQSQEPIAVFKGTDREALDDRSIVGAMADYSMAAAGLHNRQLDSRFPGNPATGTPEATNLDVAKSQHTAGYLLAFIIVHQAGLSLNKLSNLYTVAYEDRIAGNPGILAGDFHRDFADFPHILNLVDTRLAHPDSRFSAMLMFAIHGGAANPGSPLIEFAKQAETVDEESGAVFELPRAVASRQRRRAARQTGVPVSY